MAVMEWLPVDRAEVENVACALLTALLPSVVLPSRNVMVPVALLKYINAVKVTDWPCADGFRLEVSVVAVFCFITCTKLAVLPV